LFGKLLLWVGRCYIMVPFVISNSDETNCFGP
jgi:hypothetical protein